MSEIAVSWASVDGAGVVTLTYEAHDWTVRDGALVLDLTEDGRDFQRWIPLGRIECFDVVEP